MLIQTNSIPTGSLSNTSGRTGDTLKCFSGCLVQTLSIPAPPSLASSFQTISLLPTKLLPVTVHTMHFSSSPHQSFSNYSEYSHHIQTHCATEITTVLLSPVIFPCPAPVFHYKNLGNSTVFYWGCWHRYGFS